MIPAIVYSLCAIASSFCALLLLLQYRRSRVSLVLWTGVCFAGFALNNVLLVLDYFTGPSTDLSIVRMVPALVGLLLMIGAFIKETL